MTVEYVFTGWKGVAVASSVQAPFVPLLDKPPHLPSILPVQFTTFPRRKSFAAVLSLGCSLSALGQAEKTTPATPAMKAVADQVEGGWAGGGTVKGRTSELQGDHKKRAAKVREQNGYQVEVR